MITDLPSSFKHTVISDGILSACSQSPSKVAYKHGQKTRTYHELKQRIDSISGIIHSFQIPMKCNIAIVASNSIEYMEIVLAASQSGHPIATVNPKLTANDIVSICEDAEAKLVFVDQKVSSLLVGRNIRGVQEIIGIDNEMETLIAQTECPSQLPTIKEKETFTIPYTSGTTGKPKGVLVPHRSRALTLYGMADAYGCFSSDDRFLSIAPMCHGAGMIFSLAPIFFGGYAEIMDDFNPELVMKTLEDEEMTGFFGVPTHFYGMLGVDQSILDNCSGSSLKTIISNAAALPQSLKEKIVKHFGEGLLYECYGSTEGGIISNLGPDDQLRKKQCVGEPFPFTEIKILNNDGDECGPNEVGEVFTSSPYIFLSLIHI